MMLRFISISAATLLSLGCTKQSLEKHDAHSEELVPVTLQTDWFPQAEHGGFYQALQKGYFKQEGIDLTILPGGPNSQSTERLLRGKIDFAMHRADSILSLADKGLPVSMIMATLQNDPQALLLHKENPASSIDDLDGTRVMAVPGMMWIKFIQAKKGINLEIIPHDYGMERFLNDKAFVQQCLETNEPFYVRQRGAEIKLLPIRDSGFNPYHGVYCMHSTIEDSPDMVDAFVRASIRGWIDFIYGDPAPAFSAISKLNPKMTPEFLSFSHGELLHKNLVGNREQLESVGRISKLRLDQLESELRQLKLLEKEVNEDLKWYDTQFTHQP